MNQVAKPRVFISYTNRDRRGQMYANELRRVLESRNYGDVFYFDHSRAHSMGIPTWGEAGIPMEIKNRDVLIVVCTAAILASQPVEREYCIALDNGKLVIPLRHDNAPVPSGLPGIYESFSDQNYVQIFGIVADNLPLSYQKHRENEKRVERTLASIETSDENSQPPPRLGELGST